MFENQNDLLGTPSQCQTWGCCCPPRPDWSLGCGKGLLRQLWCRCHKFCVFGGAKGAGSAKGEHPQVVLLQSLGLRQFELSLGEWLGLFC